MQRKNLKVERTILTVSLLANEVKFFQIEPPTGNYQWYIYTIDTQTAFVAVNDLSNDGIRLKNNTSQPMNNHDVELFWFTIG